MAEEMMPLPFEKPVMELRRMIDKLRAHSAEHDLKTEAEVRGLEARLEEVRREVYSSLTPWQRVMIARHPKRPYFLDYVDMLFREFVELHGDRRFADDRALIGGFARLEGRPVMLVGHQKGRDTKERTARNFGMANPEGYRKALRLMRMAGRFGLPVVAFVDTPGAYPGVGAEERHIAEAIAVNLREMFDLPVPVVAVIIGEGGSGGALGIAVADRVLMLEHAYYSVISPEGCAAILWKDRAHAEKAAEALRLAGPDLKRLGVIDEIVPEPMGGAHYDPAAAAAALKKSLLRNLGTLGKLAPGARRKRRFEKFRGMGRFEEAA